jgi:hypothetical protein
MSAALRATLISGEATTLAPIPHRVARGKELVRTNQDCISGPGEESASANQNRLRKSAFTNPSSRFLTHVLPLALIHLLFFASFCL